MTFIPNWEEFEKSAEMLYLRDPINTRYSLKYCHTKGVFVVKITDNKKVSHNGYTLVFLIIYMQTLLYLQQFLNIDLQEWCRRVIETFFSYQGMSCHINDSNTNQLAACPGFTWMA